jgi:UDP-N-acetylglucosamine 2-epimerase
MRIPIVARARPDAIKREPLANAIENGHQIETKVCVMVLHCPMPDSYGFRSDCAIDVKPASRAPNLYGVGDAAQRIRDILMST